MKNLIQWMIAIYVLSMLVWSSLLKAAPPVITKIDFDPALYQMIIQGVSAQHCDLGLNSQILENQFTEDGPLVILEIRTSEKGHGPCQETHKEDFTFVFDIRTLGLKGSQVYEFTFSNPIAEGYSPIFSAEIPHNAELYRNHTVKSTGRLMKSLTGQWIIVRGDVREVLLSNRVDLDRYLGKEVAVEGTKVIHRTGPVKDADGYNPLRSLSEPTDEEAMFLFSIRSETI